MSVDDTRIHGGPDADGAARWDFSSNANACGPCPSAWQAVQQADATRYPDPGYRALRAALAAWHGVAPARVLLLASASEGIQRLTAWARRRGAQHVYVPPHGYGDYRHAARLWGLQTVSDPAVADLVWLCDPSSPLGQAESRATIDAALAAPRQSVVVVDLAYAPLRLHGEGAVTPDECDRMWQLWTPNKALGLTGVRAAYAIAPVDAQDAVAELQALGPSWPLGAHGVALLHAWMLTDTQRWLQRSRATLAAWSADLRARLQGLGWTCAPSVTPFMCARPPVPLDATTLRAHGIKLRDAASFGLPGWWRLSAQPPQALQALLAAVGAQVGYRTRPGWAAEGTS